MRYRIMDATVDANLFSMEIESAIVHRYLRVGDVLILDNAAVHFGERQLRDHGVAVGEAHGACSVFARSSAGVESH